MDVLRRAAAQAGAGIASAACRDLAGQVDEYRQDGLSRLVQRIEHGNGVIAGLEARKVDVLVQLDGAARRHFFRDAAGLRKAVQHVFMGLVHRRAADAVVGMI